MRRHYWEYFGPLMFQQANRFQKADTRESLTAKHVFIFILLHAIMTCNCCIVLNSLSLLLLIICMDLPQHLYSVYYLRSLPPRLPLPPPPPGSEASLGNSLNTSEEELHTAGITLAPKGTRDSHQPISIQIALVHALIAITFALITIAATQNPSTLGWEPFCFYTTKPLPLWRLSPPSLQVSRRG